MAVFDPRQGQVLISPVTNYYKGKAIRQELADKKQMAELRGLQIEQAEYEQSPEMRGRQEELIDNKLNAARISVDQAEVSLGADTLKYMANTLAPVTSGATSLALNGDVEGGVEYFNKEIKRLLPTLPESVQESVKKGAGEDHVYDIEEIANTKLMLSAWGKKQGGELKPAKFMIDGQPVQGFSDPYGNYYKGNRELATGNITPYDSPSVSVNIDKGEDEATKAYGKSVGNRAATRDEQSNATYQDDATLDRMQLALASGARTGFGESVILDIRGAFDTLGWVPLPEGANETEVIRALGNQLALRMRNPNSGLGLTGNTSNKDLDFLKQSVAGIDRSEKGNMLLIEMAKKVNKFKRDIASEQARIISQNGGVVPTDLDKKLMDYANNYDLLTKTERKQLTQLQNEKSDNTDIGGISDDDFRKKFKEQFGVYPDGTN